jgi:hypothetical protein
MASDFTPPTGYVFRVERARGGPVWYAKYRLQDGRQINKTLDAARHGTRW